LDKWTPELLELYKHMSKLIFNLNFLIDNELVNDYWEYKLPSGFSKPSDQTPNRIIADFIRNKYVRKAYIPKNAVDPVTEYKQYLQEKNSYHDYEDEQVKAKPKREKPKAVEKPPKAPTSKRTPPQRKVKEAPIPQQDFFDFDKKTIRKPQSADPQKQRTQKAPVPQAPFPTDLLSLATDSTSTSSNLLLNPPVQPNLTPQPISHSSLKPSSDSSLPTDEWTDFKSASPSQNPSPPSAVNKPHSASNIMNLYNANTQEPVTNKYAALDRMGHAPMYMQYQGPFNQRSMQMNRMQPSQNGMTGVGGMAQPMMMGQQPGRVNVSNQNVNSNVYTIYNNINVNLTPPTAQPKFYSNPGQQTKQPPSLSNSASGKLGEAKQNFNISPFASHYANPNPHPSQPAPMKPTQPSSSTGSAQPKGGDLYFDGLVDLDLGKQNPLPTQTSNKQQSVTTKQTHFHGLMPSDF
jgi:hypothetical protein